MASNKLAPPEQNMLLRALSDPAYYAEMANTARGYFNTGIGRLSRGEALLTGRPIAETLRKQMTAPPEQMAMDWVSPSVGIVGSIAKAANKYHRFTSTASPDTGVGYMMFANSPEKISRNYGKNYWQASTEGINAKRIDDVLPDIKKAIRDYGLHEEFQTTVDDLAKEFAPSDIVNSAQAWDNPDLVLSMYEKVFGPKGIDAVILPDGAIFFDPAHVKKAIYK